MGGRRNEEKKEREEEGIQGERRKGKKKSACFKPVRLVLLVVLSVQREGVVGRIVFTFLPSWATLFAVVQPAVSPNPAAPLCWMFCLCPREVVGPAGLCAQVLGRHCRCGPWQAIRLLISQSSSFVLGMRASSGSSPLGLGRTGVQQVDPAALGLGSSQAALCLDLVQPACPVPGKCAAG